MAYQAPEVVHLQRAVDAVKRQIATQKDTEPEPENENESEDEESERPT